MGVLIVNVRLNCLFDTRPGQINIRARKLSGGIFDGILIVFVKIKIMISICYG